MLRVLVNLQCTIIHYDRIVCYVIVETPPHYIIRTMLCCIVHAILHYDIMVYGISNIVLPLSMLPCIVL